MSEIRVVLPTCLPIVLRRCHRCASGRFRSGGTSRATASHRLLDARLLDARLLGAGLRALCTGCGEAAELTVPERRYLRSAPPGFPDLPHGDGPGPAAALLRAPESRSPVVGGPDRTGRPAWQSPYGPPPRRAHRGRWARVPALARSRSAPRRGHPSGGDD
ncbi:hypothetical protein [Streptomyces sp. NPDC018031]|uniref:hypothetical protein n=1 Tax=Streptomyces sp. NPDC018031 TaxID=3365033 RepID=UPI0037985F93